MCSSVYQSNRDAYLNYANQLILHIPYHHKDGNREPGENRRGISLSTVTGKCPEKIVYIAIYNEVISFIHGSHHGFLTGCSCTTQLLLVDHDWFKVLDRSGQTLQN